MSERASRAAASSGTTRAATPVFEAWMPLPPSSRRVQRLAGERLDHPRAAHEGVGVLGHHDLVGQPEQERGPGQRPARWRPGAPGSDPSSARSARAAVPHPWRAATPSFTSAPLDAMTASSGRPAPRACSAASANVWPSASESAPRRRSSEISTSTTSRPASVVIRADSEPGWSEATGIGARHVRAATRAGGHTRLRRDPVDAVEVARRPAATTATTAAWSARAGAESRPRWRRASPTDRRARPSIGTRRQLPSSQAGAAVAGTMAAPNPWNASVAMRRSPSTSALACSSTPAAAASRSSSSRNAVPCGSSSSSWSASSAQRDALERRRAGGRRARSGSGPRRRGGRPRRRDG